METLIKVLKNPLGLAGLILVLFWLTVAVLAPVICPPKSQREPYTIARVGFSSLPKAPTPKSIMGTTSGGYDILYGVVWGSRTAFRVGLIVVGVSSVFGVLLGGLGAFIGPIILFLLLYFGIWWRIIFVIVFISLIILLLFLLRIDYPGPYQHSKPGDRLKFRDFMNPVIITGAFVLFFHNGVIMMVGSWLTTYFATFGVLLKYSSIIVAFYWLSILIGRILTQKIIKKMDEKLFLIITGFLSTIALSVIAFTVNIIIKIIFSFLLGLFIGGIFPILLSILFSTGPKIIGRIFSFLGFVGYGSVMVFQLLSGYFVENFGKESVIYIQFANSGLCLFFILLMVRSSNILKERLRNK